MNKIEISQGVVHEVPDDLKKIIISSNQILDIWKSLTPLARNEWIFWISSAKKIETRNKRIKWMEENLIKGKKRPCCWPGCPHR